MLRLTTALMAAALLTACTGGEFDPEKARKYGGIGLTAVGGVADVAAETCTELDRTKCARLAGIVGDGTRKVSLLETLLNDSADLTPETAAAAQD